MSFCEISPWEWQTAPMRLIGKEKMLLTAHDGDRTNSMTVGWGGFGVMWGSPTVHIAVRPSRFTYDIIEKGEGFALSLLPASMSPALSLCGIKSGREGDKHKEAGLTPIKMPCGIWGIKEADVVITAKKVYASPMCQAGFCQKAPIERWYSREPYHTLYFASVLGIYVRK